MDRQSNRKLPRNLEMAKASFSLYKIECQFYKEIWKFKTGKAQLVTFRGQTPTFRRIDLLKVLNRFFLKYILNEKCGCLVSRKITKRSIPGLEKTENLFGLFSLRYFPEGVPHLPGESDGLS